VVTGTLIMNFYHSVVPVPFTDTRGKFGTRLVTNACGISPSRMKVAIVLVSLLVSCYAQEPGCVLKNEGDLSPKKQGKFRAIRSDTPDQAAVRFDMAIDYATAGNTEKALSLLEEALAETTWLDPAAEEAFRTISGCAAFQRLVEKERKKYPPVSTSRIVHVIAEKDLIPEGIASDPVDGTLYISSIFHRKIVEISPQGTISDFVPEAQDGLFGVLGIKVDTRDRSVWAATAFRGESALVHLDRSGKILHQYRPTKTGRHEFNDLVVTMKGDVLVTDDLDNAVYKLPHGGTQLVRIDLEKRQYPNGIALADDEQSVYVAHAYGVVFMDLDGKGITDLQKPKDVSLAQIDGLYVRKGNLLAIQNAFGGNRIVELRLAPDGKQIVSGRLLEYRSANLDLPTTGTVYHDRFYYIVNSQIDHEENGELKNPGTLAPIRIAALKLD